MLNEAWEVDSFPESECLGPSLEGGLLGSASDQDQIKSRIIELRKGIDEQVKALLIGQATHADDKAWRQVDGEGSDGPRAYALEIDGVRDDSNSFWIDVVVVHEPLGDSRRNGKADVCRAICPPNQLLYRAAQPRVGKSTLDHYAGIVPLSCDPTRRPAAPGHPRERKRQGEGYVRHAGHHDIGCFPAEQSHQEGNLREGALRTIGRAKPGQPPEQSAAGQDIIVGRNEVEVLAPGFEEGQPDIAPPLAEFLANVQARSLGASA